MRVSMKIYKMTLTCSTLTELWLTLPTFSCNLRIHVGQCFCKSNGNNPKVTGDSDFSIVPCLCHVDLFTFHISILSLKFTIFIHLSHSQWLWQCNDPNSTHDACHIWTQLNDLALNEFLQIERLLGVREVRYFPLGTQIFSLSHTCVMLISSLFTFQKVIPFQFCFLIGVYKPRVRCYETSELCMKFERCLDSESKYILWIFLLSKNPSSSSSLEFCINLPWDRYGYFLELYNTEIYNKVINGS